MINALNTNLPRTPIKASELRGANFEAQFGEGGTELDSLEALHPGALRKILVEHIERYYDADLNQSVENSVDRFQDEIDGAASEVRDIHSAEIAARDEQRNAITRAFEQVAAVAVAAVAVIVTVIGRVAVGAVKGAGA
jgi:hypothetical protein